ncbi:MAG TPA: hypothetical protein PLU43_10860 [Lachnospiraceae bacterium]|nr:hypothetical protein [Lachnospiraceae bacterium]
MTEIFEDKKVWLFGILCVAAGVALGLLFAPLTHGIRISLWSNNALGSGKLVSYMSEGGSNSHKYTADIKDDTKTAGEPETGKRKHGRGRNR